MDVECRRRDVDRTADRRLASGRAHEHAVRARRDIPLEDAAGARGLRVDVRRDPGITRQHVDEPAGCQSLQARGGTRDGGGDPGLRRRAAGGDRGVVASAVVDDALRVDELQPTDRHAERLHLGALRERELQPHVAGDQTRHREGVHGAALLRGAVGERRGRQRRAEVARVVTRAVEQEQLGIADRAAAGLQRRRHGQVDVAARARVERAGGEARRRGLRLIELERRCLAVLRVGLDGRRHARRGRHRRRTRDVVVGQPAHGRRGRGLVGILHAVAVRVDPGQQRVDAGGRAVPGDLREPLGVRRHALRADGVGAGSAVAHGRAGDGVEARVDERQRHGVRAGQLLRRDLRRGVQWRRSRDVPDRLVARGGAGREAGRGSIVEAHADAVVQVGGIDRVGKRVAVAQAAGDVEGIALLVARPPRDRRRTGLAGQLRRGHLLKTSGRQ